MLSRSKNGAKSHLQEKYFINERVRAENVVLITQDGENIGVVTKSKALEMAQNAGLDLVQVSESGETPVVKIMDFGKFLYEKKKQLSGAKKHQKTLQLKEIKLRPNIGEQDYKTKLKKAVQFFKEGKKVKFTLQLKGREIPMMKTIGPQFFERVTSDLEASNVGTLVEEKDQRGGSYWSKIYFAKTK